MRQILFILYILTSLTNYCSGQIDSTKATNNIRIGGNIGGMFSVSTSGLGYYANLSAEKGRHFIACGPVISLKNTYSSGYNYEAEYHVNGLNLVYQINPNPKGKVFDLYFLANIIFLKYKDKGINNYGYYGIYDPYTLRHTSIETHLGYGFKMKFLQHFYISNFIGIGYYNEFLISDHDNNANDRRYRNYEMGVVINFGLGYAY